VGVVDVALAAGVELIVASLCVVAVVRVKTSGTAVLMVAAINADIPSKRMMTPVVPWSNAFYLTTLPSNLFVYYWYACIFM
jgi:hypothetical protein